MVVHNIIPMAAQMHPRQEQLADSVKRRRFSQKAQGAIRNRGKALSISQRFMSKIERIPIRGAIADQRKQLVKDHCNITDLSKRKDKATP